MSMMRCEGCDFFVDTDDDPESLYVIEDLCICERCREELEEDEDA